MERKEAIEVIKKNWPDSSFTMLREALETLIPELAESEDEKMANIIRESLANVTSENKLGEYGLSHKDVSDWLEKRGDKKLVEDRYMEGYLNGINDASKTLKSDAWSEEDERHVNSLLKRLEGLCRNEFERTRFAINEDEDWLKSLKDRVQPQPKQGWSEEDEEIANKGVLALKSCAVGFPTDEKFANEFEIWLKSLRPQSQWKPSDEQISVLEFVMEDIEKDSIRYAVLNSVLKQLKKLREE